MRDNDYSPILAVSMMMWVQVLQQRMVQRARSARLVSEKGSQGQRSPPPQLQEESAH